MGVSDEFDESEDEVGVADHGDGDPRARAPKAGKEVRKFLAMVDNVLRWGVTEHLGEVVAGLETVLRGAT